MDVLDADRGFQKEVDTVRALHQTVVSLRAALERSRVEIEELKERVWSSESCELALQNLSVENHILRQKIISVNDFKETTTQTSIPYITVDTFEIVKQTNCVTEVAQLDIKDDLLNNSLDIIKSDSPVKASGLKYSSGSISPVYLFQSELSPIKSPTRTSELPEASPRSKTPVSNKSELSPVKSLESGLFQISPRDDTLSNISDLSPVKSGKSDSSKKNLQVAFKSDITTTSDINLSESSPVKSEGSTSKYSLKQDNSKTELSPDTQHSSNLSDSARESTPRKNSSTTSKSDLSTVKTVLESKELKLSLRKPAKAKTNSEVTKSASERSPRSRDIKLDTGRIFPRKSSLKSKDLEAKKNIKFTKFKKSTRKVTEHEVTLHPVEITDPGKSPKRSKVKGNKFIVAPRQTVVTVNVTLKSPRKDKVEENTTTVNKPTLLTVTTELPPFNSSKNETSEEYSAQEITEDTSSERTMDEEQNNIQDEENDNNEQKESDNEGDEVDDIELIFTTGETTTVIKEELVSIADGNDGDGDCDTPVLMNYRTVDFDTTDMHLSCDTMDKELDDDVFQETENDDNFENENTENFNFQTSSQIHNSKSDNSINRDSYNTATDSQRDKSLKSCYSYQDSSFESRSLDKDESFDKFDDKEKYLHNMWSNNSVLVETDISKCGIVDPELPLSSTRRNTCPNPVPYRPIMHREALAKHNTRTLAVKFSARNDNTPRPVLNENNSPKTESEAQTDISALPSLWKSESYLAHKVAHQFTTLPSKFPMPISQKHLRLSEKTKEARRVLLSDINFTSMVPELSRSADHLYQEGLEVMQTCGYGQYLNPPGPQLRRYNTGDSLTSPSFAHSQKFTWSPSDYSNFSSTKFDNSNQYLNRYRGSLTSINQNSFDVPDHLKRRSLSSSHWRQNVPVSFDNSRFMQSGQGPYRSVPSSPTRSRSVPFISSYGGHMQQYPAGFKHSQLRFGRQGYGGGLRYINGSLPELHGDLDSGDSTDSLVEEAEQYLRSSIDCIVSGRDMSHVSHMKRRSSAPCSGRDSSPPRNWTPFLPHGIKDLRSDNWVKVIGPEGKIRGGRVRYVGYVLGQPEPYVGLELATSAGNCDGSFNNRRYFECSPNYALFIPFKKVVMGWRN